MAELRIPYALKDNRIVYIDDVERGLACGCICPKCGQPLKARKGKVREKHFAHHGDVECKGSYEETMHRLAIQILHDERRVMAPQYEDIIPPNQLIFQRVDVEVRDMGEGIRPDVVGTCEDGTKICVEIRCTHAVDEIKLSKLRDLDLNCLEIDIRKHRLDEAELKNFLLGSVDDRKWLSHPEYERIYQEKKTKEQAQLQKEAADIEQKRKEEEELNKILEEKVRKASSALKSLGVSGDDDNLKGHKIVSRPKVTPLKDGPIKDYYERLRPHAAFDKYTEAHTVVVNYGLSLSRKSIYVIHANQPLRGVRFPFHLSQITFEGGRYVVEHIGAYAYENIAERKLLSIKEND